MSRDVSWGFYIAQFTYLVGVAAGGVMVVLPYYLHDYKAFGRITILGEFLAIAAVLMCLLFIFADLGQPIRIMNVILYPTPNSILFWDMIVLKCLSPVESFYRLERTCSGKERPSLPEMGQGLDLYFHPLGIQYPYGYGFSLRRYSRKALLADRYYGGPFSVFGLCGRPGPSFASVSDCPQGDQLRSR